MSDAKIVDSFKKDDIKNKLEQILKRNDSFTI